MSVSKRWFVWRIIIMSLVLLMSFALLFFYEMFVSSKILYKERVLDIEKSLQVSLERLSSISNLIEYSDSIRLVAGIDDTLKMNRELYSLYFGLIPDLYRIELISADGESWKRDVDDKGWIKLDSTEIKTVKERLPRGDRHFRWSRYYIEDNKVLISAILQNLTYGKLDNALVFDFEGNDVNNMPDYRYIDKESFAYIVDKQEKDRVMVIMPFGSAFSLARPDTASLINYENILNRFLISNASSSDEIVEFSDLNKDYYISSSRMNLNDRNIEYGVVLSVRELVKEYRTSAFAVSIFLFLIFAVYLYFIVSSYVKYRRELDKEDADIAKYIRKGESATVEFKSSLRWDYIENKPNKVLEDVIMKTLAAFNNSDGGRLFIGIKDDGTALGLESDYSTLKGGDKDYFELHLRSLITAQYGMEFCSNGVIIRFPHYDGVEICEVKVRRGIVPLYSTGKAGGKDEKFYIRSGNSSREIDKPSEIIDYIHKRWKK